MKIAIKKNDGRIFEVTTFNESDSDSPFYRALVLQKRPQRRQKSFYGRDEKDVFDAAVAFVISLADTRKYLLVRTERNPEKYGSFRSFSSIHTTIKKAKEELPQKVDSTYTISFSPAGWTGNELGGYYPVNGNAVIIEAHEAVRSY